MIKEVSDFYRQLKPYIAKDFSASTGGNTITTVISEVTPHSLSGTKHTGVLAKTQAPWVATDIADAITLHAAIEDAHHAKVHNIIGSNHTVTGDALDIIGLTATDTLGKIIPSSSPGVSTKILKTDTNGKVNIVEVITPLITSEANILLQPIDNVVIDAVLFDVLNAAYFEDTVESLISITSPEFLSSSDMLINAGNTLNLDSTDNLIKIKASNTLQTENFVSQAVGWRGTYLGEFDVRYLFANEMKVIKFIADIEQALAGSQIISKSVTSLHTDLYIPYPGETINIIVDDLPSAFGMATFESGDYIALRDFSRAAGGLEVANAWGTVASYTDLEDGSQQWAFTRDGTNPETVISQVGTRTLSNSNDDENVITKVTGVSEFDLMLVFMVLDRNAVVGPPSGWNLITSDYNGDIKASLYYKFASDSEPSDYTFSFTSSGYNSLSMYAYSGVNNNATFYGTLFSDVIEAPGQSVISIDNIRAVSPHGDMMLVFAGLYSEFEDISVTVPDGMTERSDSEYNNLFTWAAQWLQEGSGNIGEINASIDGTASYITFALNLLPEYELTLETGYATPGTIIYKDSIILDYGVSGNGYIETSAVDGTYGSNSPYQRIMTWETHPTNVTLRTLTGHLNGVFSVANEFGFFAGDGVTNDDSYLRLSSEAFRLNNIPIKLYSSGTQKVNIDANGTDVWFGDGSGNKKLTWNGTILGVTGGVTISEASGFSGSGYLKIGSGTYNSTLDGWYIDGTQIIGQLDGVTQTNLTTDGKISAGAGNTIMDIDGITIRNQTTDTHASQSRNKALTLTKSDGTLVGSLHGYFLSGTTTYGVELYSRSPDTEKSVALFGAEQAGTTYASDSAGNPRIIAFSNAASGADELSLYAATKIALFRSDSATPDISIDSTGINFNYDVNVNNAFQITGSVSETALGVDNVRIGINAGSARIILEDASATQWEIDNTSGALRFFVPGTVYGQFTTNGFQSASNLFAGGVTFAGEDGIRLVTSAGYGYIDTKGSGGLIFRYDNTNGGTERMRIADGTVSITGNLAISGNCDPATLGGSWNNLSFISGWGNLGGGWQTGQYKKIGDMVFLRGFVYRTSGSSAYIATLPSGYRPPAPDRWAVTTDAGAHGNIQIDSNGDIQVIVGSPTDYMTLSGIAFSTV